MTATPRGRSPASPTAARRVLVAHPRDRAPRPTADRRLPGHARPAAVARRRSSSCANRRRWQPATTRACAPWPSSPPAGAHRASARARRGCHRLGVPTARAPRRSQAVLRADDMPADVIGSGRPQRWWQRVGEKRATWRHWNLHAEASRQLIGLRFATTTDREAILGLVVDAAEAASLRLTPPDLACTPAVLQRADGSSVFRPATPRCTPPPSCSPPRTACCSSRRPTTAPTAAGRRAASPGAARDRDVSGRVVDVLVGPAGAGKTTAMRALRNAWERARAGLGHRARPLRGSRTGPRRRARDRDRDHRQVAPRPQHARAPASWSSIDEASLAGTLTLDRIASPGRARPARRCCWSATGRSWPPSTPAARSRCSCTPATTRPNSPRSTASTSPGKPTPPCSCASATTPSSTPTPQHDRLRAGDHDEMLDAAYLAWQADLDAGRASVMIAADQRHRDRAQRSAPATTASSPGTSPPRRRSRCTTAPMPPSATWSSRAATTGACSPARQLGAQRRPLDRHRHAPRRLRHRAQRRRAAASRCPPPTSPSTSSSATPSPLTAPRVTTVDTAHADRAPGMTREALYVAHDPRPRSQHRLRHHRPTDRTRTAARAVLDAGSPRLRASAPSPPPTKDPSTSSTPGQHRPARRRIRDHRHPRPTRPLGRPHPALRPQTGAARPL